MANPIDLDYARAMQPASAGELRSRGARARLTPWGNETHDNTLYRYMIQRLETQGGHVTYVPHWGLLTDAGQDPAAISWRAINGTANDLVTAVAMCDTHFKDLLKVNETYYLQPQRKETSNGN